jgi:hypothetical protein
MLAGLGIHVPDPCENMPLETAPDMRDVTRDVTNDLTNLSQPQYPTAVTRDVARVLAVSSVTQASGERVATAARAVKKAGFASINPSDPRFLALVDAGCTDDEFKFIAAEAVVKGKGWAWLLATLKGRREDAAREAAAPSMPQQTPQTARQRADAATVAAWVPQLAAKP